MDTFVYILTGVSTALAGLNISQYFFFKSQRKKAAATAEQEQNTADDGKFELLKKQIEFQTLLVAQYREEQNVQLDKIKYLQHDYERRLKGIQKLLSKEVGSKKYAEKHICLNVECKDRRPGLGEFHTEDPVMPEES